jgi:pimeloyl-ACP methyl ester carboxylesterase
MERIKLKVMMAMIVLNPVLSGVTREEPGVFPSAPKDYVVLLHGLGRTSLSMKRLEWTLKKENYRVVNLGYPSTRLSIQEIADGRLEETLSRQVTDRSAKVHFVTHSLGGIVLRQYLSDHKIENLGRVVMLAPPNQGSELADRLKASCLYRFFTGPSGQQLGTDAFSVPKRLGPADFALGIVAGDRSLNPVFSAWIPGPDDGKVSVRSTQLDGMQDFLVVHHSHTWMAWNKTVNAAVVQLLKTGRFQPAGLKSQGARAGGSSETSKVDPRPRIPQLE